MNNDLISRSALIETLAVVAKKFAKSDEQKALIGRVFYIIEHKSPVDAVEVVRCKECKHCIHLSRTYRSDIACDKLHTDRIHPNFSCSYGEWRADDGK